MTTQPSPGIFLVKPITTPNPWGDKKESKIKRGTVIARGLNLITDGNAVLEIDKYANIGDTVDFLTYDGEYDLAYIDGQDYHYVKAQDLRGVVNAKK